MINNVRRKIEQEHGERSRKQMTNLFQEGMFNIRNAWLGSQVIARDNRARGDLVWRAALD